MDEKKSHSELELRILFTLFYQLGQRGGQLLSLNSFLTDFSVKSTRPLMKLCMGRIPVGESETSCLLHQCNLHLTTVKITSQTQGFSVPFTVPKSYIFFEIVLFPIVISLKVIMKQIDIN